MVTNAVNDIQVVIILTIVNRILFTMSSYFDFVKGQMFFVFFYCGSMMKETPITIMCMRVTRQDHCACVAITLCNFIRGVHLSTYMS